MLSYEDGGPSNGRFADLDLNPEETYKRYLTWCDGERIMKEHLEKGTAPQLDLHLLPNLRSVETVGLHVMRTIQKRWGQPETRRFVETGLIEENTMRSRWIPYVPPCHLPTFIIALSASGTALSSLTVHRLEELFKGKEYDNDNPALNLKGLRRLHINLAEI